MYLSAGHALPQALPSAEARSQDEFDLYVDFHETGDPEARHQAALRFAREGAAVVVADIDEAHVGLVAKQIRDAGGHAVAKTVDVSIASEVDALVRAAVREFGRIDIMMNNAAAPHGAPVADTTDADWRRVMSVTLDGVFYGTRAALRHMEPQGFGAIVNTASIGAFHPAPDYPFYAAAKAGVVAFTRSVGHEVAGAGIRVNAVAPGSTATAIMIGTDTGSFSSRNACGRIGRPEEIAEAIAFLASERASYCFGEILSVSGAWA